MNDRLRQGIERSMWHRCDLPGCDRPRHRIDRWCIAHVGKAQHYGHPQARPLNPKLWVTERESVRAVLDANQDHPGQQHVLRWLTGWVQQANTNSAAFKGADEVARLTRHGVQPVDILAEAIACTAYLQANRRAVPDDVAWDFAVSRAVFALAPRQRRHTRGRSMAIKLDSRTQANRTYSPKPRKSALRFVGGHLRTVLAPFIVNVVASMRTPQQREQDLIEAMKAPLKAPGLSA